MRLFFIIASIIFISLSVFGNQNLTEKEVADHINSYVKSEMKKRKINGLSVSVVVDDKILFNKGFGLRDRNKKLPVDSDTIFQVGSLSKVFTAIGIMQLVEDGQIKLDDTIAQYIPELRLKDSRENIITIRMLLTHLSGLQSFILKDCILEEPNPQLISEYPDFISELDVSLTTPGRVSSYGNTGYTLLGLIIESVSGKSYDNYIKENIFSPIKMERSSTYLEKQDINNLSFAYDGNKEVHPMIVRDIPAAGYNTSSNDMGLFIKELLKTYNKDSLLLQSDTYRSMLIPQNRGIFLDRGHVIGLNWWLANPINIKETIASHGGDTAPYNAFLTTIPELGIGVFIANNTGGVKNQGDATDIGSELLKNIYQWKTNKTIETREIPVSKNIDFKIEDIEKYKGEYSTGMGLIQIRSQGKKLFTYLQGQKLFLQPREDGLFNLQYRLFDFIPIEIPDLKKISIDFFKYENSRYIDIILGNVWHFTGPKIKKSQQQDDFIKYIGSYEYSGHENNFITDIAIELDNESGLLTLKYKNAFGISTFPLIPLSDNTMIIPGEGRDLGLKLTFKTVENQTILNWSGLTLYKR